MANEDKRIDQLPAVTILSPDSLLVLQQNGQAMCLTVEQLMAYINDEATQAVLFAPQTLTDEQKEQARDNIGAVANIRWGTSGNTTNFIRDIGSKTLYTYLRLVRYDDYQTDLTEEEKAQARANIGAETSERMELITQFQLTENVSGLIISADADGNPFRLEKAVVTLNTNGKCDAGNSGAFSFYLGTLANVYVLGLYFSGFPFRGYETSAGKYRNSGFNAYGSVKGGVGLAIGHCGDYGNTVSNAGYLGNMVNGYCGDVKIEQIRVSGTMPKNATISVYGVKAVD